MTSKLFKVLGIVVAVVLVFLVAKNSILKTAIETGGKVVLGTDVKIGSFKIGFLSQKVRIKDFKIYNPKGFEKGVMVSIPEVSVDFDLGALIKGKIHLPLLVLNLEEMVVIKNKDGVLNVDELKISKKTTPDDDTKKKKDKKKSKKVDMQIDRLVLTIRRVVSKSYQGTDKPTVEAFDVGIKDKEYKNIGSAEELSILLMSSAMGPTAFKGAAIYGAAGVLGVAILPVGVAGVLLSEDGVTEEFNVSLEDLFEISVDVIDGMGKISSKKSSKGVIKAKVRGANVSVLIEKGEKNKSKITISARKFMIPNKKTAEGILFEIKNRL